MRTYLAIVMFLIIKSSVFSFVCTAILIGYKIETAKINTDKNDIRKERLQSQSQILWWKPTQENTQRWQPTLILV